MTKQTRWRKNHDHTKDTRIHIYIKGERHKYHAYDMHMTYVHTKIIYEHRYSYIIYTHILGSGTRSLDHTQQITHKYPRQEHEISGVLFFVTQAEYKYFHLCSGWI